MICINESRSLVIDRVKIEPYAFEYHSCERPIRSTRLKCVTFDFPHPKTDQIFSICFFMNEILPYGWIKYRDANVTARTRIKQNV